MFSPSSLLLVHLVGLAIGLRGDGEAGSAGPVSADAAFLPTYLAVVRPITRQIILGLVLLLLSGIGFMAIGHSFTPRLAASGSLASVSFS